MADTVAFKRRLSRVRRRWKAAAALDGLLLVATEALGLFLVLMLADAIYRFRGEVRLAMLGGAVLVLAVFFVRNVLGPVLRRLPDGQIALYIEERSPKAEGSVISALECDRDRKGGFSAFIARFLVADAVQRIDATNVRVFANLARLKKHLVAACALLAVFAVSGISFPKSIGRQSERIMVPWESIRREREEARLQEEAKATQQRLALRPIEIAVQPKGMTILRGKGIEFTVTLSRRPPESPVFHYQFAGAEGKGHAAEMQADEARFTYKLPFPDINEGFAYFVTAAAQASEKYEIHVHDPLAVRGIELTYRYPDYLARDPQTRLGPSGDVTALAGTRVDVRILANNPLKSGTLRFDDKATLPLKGGAKPQDGASASFTVQKDGTYTYEIADIYGETAKSDDFFFIKSVPDKPPTISMISPKVDMTIHPLCEVTFGAEVSDDFAVRDVTARLTYYCSGKPEPMPLPMTPTTQKDFRNFTAGKVERVLELDALTPKPQVGDMIFYYMEITDRKGQTAKTDLFFIKLTPLEVAAAWPEKPTAPDLPHWDYLWTPDIILLAAAAWNIEQQRGKIPTDDFAAKCTELAGRMEPAMDSQKGLNLFGGKKQISKELRERAGPIIDLAFKKLHDSLQLVKDFEPGKAALLMQEALALGESVNTDKSLQETQLATAPIHTGQPSGGYNQDAVQEQMEYRLPEVMSDSLTAFQQEDNPRHFLPPDYRRALRLKERTAPLIKELKMAGEIYASQEQLIEMAREMFGHRKLREAAEMSCTNDPAAGSGTKGEMIRVDKRAIPYASMDPRADMPDAGNKGKMKEAKPERIKGPRYARLEGNERDGPGNPHRSQTPGGSSESEDEPENKPAREKRKFDFGDQWKIEANDRRPRQNQGGGGGSDSQEQQPQTGMEQSQQQPGGASSSSQSGEKSAQQLAARQADLAGKAADLARDVAKQAEPGDTLAQRAATGLRDASAGMKQAAASFQRGDLKAGIAQARQAQEAMRSAMHGLRAAQFGTLAEALAMAQKGAAGLVENQYHVSQGTQQIERRVRELGGEETPRQPGRGQPGKEKVAKVQPGKGEPAGGGPGEGEPGKGESGKGQLGKGKVTKGQPGKGETGGGEPGEGEPGKAEAGKGTAGKGQYAKAEAGKGEPGGGEPGEGEPGKGRPGKGKVAKGRAGKGEPGAGEPSEGEAGKEQAAAGKGGAGPSRAAVEEAKARDPRIAAKLAALAGEQLKLSQTVKDFEGYVGDLAKWSRETEKERVTSSLKGIADGLKQDDVAQRMVDAGVDLSQQDIGSARATQEQIEGALEKMTAHLREAADVLAGSKTGIIGRTARQAKEVGAEVRRLAGLPQPEAAGGKQPPGEGQPTQATAGGGEDGGGQPGKSEPGKGMPTKGQKAGREDSLKEKLAADESSKGAAMSEGRPGPGTNVPGGAGNRDEINDLWMKAQDLARTLGDEGLADKPTLDYIHGRVEDPKSFREMFDKVKQAEAGRFANVVSGVGKSLDDVLKETLAARKLHAEQREECPTQYRSFVHAYFEAMSRTVTGKD